jgi:hypothetical protein
VLGWLLATGALLYAALRVFTGYPGRAARTRCLAAREVAFLDAAAETIFPPGGAIEISGAAAGIPAYTDRWLAVSQPHTRRLMRMLFFLVEHATLFFPAPGRGGMRRFSSLAPEQRAAALDGWRTSRFFARRLVFTSLRAILTMGYVAHPSVLRHLRLAPLTIDTPVCEADLLYPPVGRARGAIPFTASDLTPPSDGTPVDLDGPLHPAYAERAS